MSSPRRGRGQSAVTPGRTVTRRFHHTATAVRGGRGACRQQRRRALQGPGAGGEAAGGGQRCNCRALCCSCRGGGEDTREINRHGAAAPQKVQVSKWRRDGAWSTCPEGGGGLQELLSEPPMRIERSGQAVDAGNRRLTSSVCSSTCHIQSVPLRFDPPSRTPTHTWCTSSHLVALSERGTPLRFPGSRLFKFNNLHIFVHLRSTHTHVHTYTHTHTHMNTLAKQLPKHGAVRLEFGMHELQVCCER